MNNSEPVYEHLKEMLESLEAHKGAHYCKLVVCIFSQTNMVEYILNSLDGPESLKEILGNNFGIQTMQLAGSILWYEVRRRHVAFDTYDNARQNELGQKLAEEFRNDLTMLHNKQMEFVK